MAIEQMYRVKEAAEMFAVTKQTVYNLISNGDITSVKIGRSSRIPESAIAKFIEISSHRARYSKRVA